MFSTLITFAQSSRVRGKVSGKSDGLSLPGVNVVVKGTTNGTVTDIDGNYEIEIQKNQSLVFSFLGFTSQEVLIVNQTELNIVLESSSIGMNEVVVTALGIEKKARSLTYSTQTVGGDELSKAKDVNLINSLTGKSAGVSIRKSSSGVGGSSKVVIRGNRSASGSNQPLYVIDGIPMFNSSSVQPSTSIGGKNDAGARDGGDGIGNLNPDDIESISILKGASASALYGSQAANGVVVITTKKGKSGKTSVSVSSNTTFESPFVLPDLQNSYGESSGGYSWGNKTTKKGHNPKDFFETGVNKINSISVSSGTEKAQTYFSYANTTANGIIEGNKLSKHNFNFRETAKMFNDKFSIDGSVNLIQQRINNRPSPGGFYINPLVGLYRFPRGENIQKWNSGFESYDPLREINVQQWHKNTEDTFEQNPWWITRRTPSEDSRNRVIASLTTRLELTPEFSVQFRGSADASFDKYEQHMYASTCTGLTGSDKGRLISDRNENILMYGDVLLNYNKTFNDFTLTASIGSSINHTKFENRLLDSRGGSGLEYPNVFSLGNMIDIGYLEESKGTIENQSVFGTAQLGYKDGLFLDVTGRNDWSSALAYTKSANKGFFYPSVGLTAIISEFIEMPTFINFGKIRGSISSVGNTIPVFLSRPISKLGSGGVLINNQEAAFSDLKPEISKSIEFGTEWRFLDNKITFDLTYYKTNTKNQFFRLPAPAGSGASWYYVNSGDIENKGVEIALGLHPISTSNFQWKNYFNFSTNQNKVVKLHPDLPIFNFGEQSSSSYWMRMTEGGEYGDVYGKKFQRDENNKIILGDDGLPTSSADFEKIANINPDFNLGWNSSLQYKDFNLSFLIDGRFGGDVISITEAELDQWGVSARSASDRNRGYVELEGHKFNDVEAFYKKVGGRAGISEYYVYNGTNIRLRELSLAYNLPKDLLKKVSFINNASLSLVGRNLFFFMNDAPYDPDAVLSTDNDLQGVDVFGMPTTRSLGFNIKVSF